MPVPLSETRVNQKQPELRKRADITAEKKYFEKSRYLVAPKASLLPLQL